MIYFRFYIFVIKFLQRLGLSASNIIYRFFCSVFNTRVIAPMKAAMERAYPNIASEPSRSPFSVQHQKALARWMCYDALCSMQDAITSRL